MAREVETHDGAIILERGEGDSVFAVFTQGSDAVAAALDIQRAFQKEPWPRDVPVVMCRFVYAWRFIPAKRALIIVVRT